MELYYGTAFLNILLEQQPKISLKVINSFLSIDCLMKHNEAPSVQFFLYIFHGSIDTPNEEFMAYVISLNADYRNNNPTKSLSMLELRPQIHPYFEFRLLIKERRYIPSCSCSFFQQSSIKI
jgi:hypothetical protein